MPLRPPRFTLAPGLEIARIVTGLWQIADIERNGRDLDPERGADLLADYAAAGYDTFDAADHYGSAESMIGRLNRGIEQGTRRLARPRALTKFSPLPGLMPVDIIADGLRRALRRMETRTIDLMQLHWWTFEHPGYLDALAHFARFCEEGAIRHIGLSNFDTPHLRLAVRHGLPIVSNQVSLSLLDRRASGAMAQFCGQNGVSLLAYGTLCGGFLSERWLGRPEPAMGDLKDWSRAKYKRFIDVTGGWPAFQRVLGAAASIARKHGVSVANVATAWVLAQRAVGAVIIGARLGEREYKHENAVSFEVALDAEDHARLEAAFAQTQKVPGDCGDEFRKAPFLTASGDLGEHLRGFPRVYAAKRDAARPDRLVLEPTSRWEQNAGYSLAHRVGSQIFVSATRATQGDRLVIAPDDVAAQATHILDKISAALAALGGSCDDVVRTRIYLAAIEDWRQVAQIHARYFGLARPATTLVEVSRLIGEDCRIEIEAEAILAPRPAA